MSLHARKEYIKYLWRAKTRHGVHSPFVYDFVDNVLQNKNLDNNITVHPDIPSSLPKKYRILLAHIMNYYSGGNRHFTEKSEFIFRNCETVEDSLDELQLPNTRVMVIANIHAKASNSANWRKMHNHPKVRLSMDIFGIGLLFFRTEFKEKQHFILKY